MYPHLKYNLNVLNYQRFSIIDHKGKNKKLCLKYKMYRYL